MEINKNDTSSYEINKIDVLSDEMIILAIEKTINSRQNIELKNSSLIVKIRDLLTNIEEVNYKKYQRELSDFIQKIRSQILLFVNGTSGVLPQMKAYYRPKNFNYDESKKDNGVNDYRMLRVHYDLVEEIAMNAITLGYIDPLRTLIPDSNYGNVLDDLYSKNFFKPYYLQYKKFAGKRFEFINENRFNYLSTFDIKKYYDRIKFSELENIINKYSSKDIELKPILELYRSICIDGLPQGPMFSHFFSSLLIYDLKSEFKTNFPMFEIIYYVDDINVFFNCESVEKAGNVDAKINDFLEKYLKPKLVIPSKEDVLNKEKHQLIRITEKEKLSTILLQISALDEIRKDDSDELSSFRRSQLARDFQNLLIDLQTEIEKGYSKKEEINPDIFDENPLGNIIERGNRFRTYRQLLLANSKQELVKRINELVENDKKRCSEKVSKNDSSLYGSMYDKSFENYIRAIVSVGESFGLDSKEIKDLINKRIIMRVKEVFTNQTYREEYYNTFSDIVKNILIEYKYFKTLESSSKFKQSPYKFINEYSIESLFHAIKNIRDKAIKSEIESNKHNDKVHVEYTIQPKNISRKLIKKGVNQNEVNEQQIYEIVPVKIKGISVFREFHLINQLYGYLANLFKLKTSGNENCIFKEDGTLLKVYEIRILSLLRNGKNTPAETINSVIKVMSDTIVERENEICDPLVQDVLKIVSKKISNNSMIDSIIYVHHFVRDLWKNGAKDLPFYTLHNHEHSVELIKILNRINDSSNGMFAHNLNNYEFYALIMAIYLHDLGMLFFDYDSFREMNRDPISRGYEVSSFQSLINLEKSTKEMNRNQRNDIIIDFYKKHRKYRSDLTRANHHYNTKRFKEIDEIVKGHLGAFVKNICYNHGVDKKDMHLINEYIGKDVLDSLKVSTYLRFLDGLDSCKNRVSKNLYKTILNYVSDDDIDVYTKTHWAKHLIIDEIKSYRLVPSKEYFYYEENYKDNNVVKLEMRINESISTTKTTQKPPSKIRIEVDELDKPNTPGGYLKLSTSPKVNNTIFYKFVDEYFFWTINGVEEMNSFFKEKYKLVFVFSYSIGNLKENFSTIIYNFLQ